jgi:RND family efflux transporter MFP subunit
MKPHLAIGLLSALLLASCSGEEAPPAPPPRPVKSIVLQQTNAVPLSFAGTVEPQIVTNYSFQILGRMIARNVQVGDAVEKGTLLAVLEATALEQDVQAAKASLASAQASSANARVVEQRQQGLFAKTVVSQAAVEDAVQASEAAQAAEVRAKANLAKAQERLSYARIAADYAGVVTSTAAEAGQVVAAGQTVVTVARPDLRDAVVDLPRSAAAGVKLGDPFSVMLQSDARQTVSGRVRRIEPSADPVTRSQRIRIALADAPAGFRLGSVISVSLPDTRPSELLLPVSAIVRRDGRTFVWIVPEGGDAVAQRDVTITETGGERVSVTAGLKPGDRVVVAGVSRLTDGQKIRISGDIR